MRRTVILRKHEPKDAPSRRKRVPKGPLPLAKAPSGVRGLDEITGGGLPRGRPTLVCGGAGSGKTLFALEFLIRGAQEYGEPGVFMSFEESAEELAANVASLGFDLEALQSRGDIFIDQVRVDRSELEEAGEYDLEGLFVRLSHAIETVKAQRVVLDTIESLFAGMPNPLIVRSELRRLFRWLKDRGLTVVLTGEKGEGSLTRQGLEEYVSDCVIFLDHRVSEEVSTRRLRIVKYRGSAHGTNEYPFLIDEGGISIMPVTSVGLTHDAPTTYVSSGIARLDEMLGGKGYYEGSTILVSGTAGSGKTSLAASFVRSACARGLRALYFAFEESPRQIVRNMRSVGLDLERPMKEGNLEIIPSRPTTHGLELHLLSMYRALERVRPQVVVVDPISNLVAVGHPMDVRSMLTRLIDFLKLKGVTALLTSLLPGERHVERGEVHISSLVDTWLLLEVVRSGGEANRTLTIVKSRGMPHSNQVCEFRLTRAGIELVDTYLGPNAVLMGSARVAQEAEDRARLMSQEAEITRLRVEREHQQRRLENQLTNAQDEFAAAKADLDQALQEAIWRRDRLVESRKHMAQTRRAFSSAAGPPPEHEGE